MGFTPSPEAPMPLPFRPLRLYRGWWIAIAGFLALFVHGGATTYVFSVLLPPMEAGLGWSRTTLVGAITLGTGVTALTGMVLGPLFDRHGARWGMSVGAAAGGALLVGLALVRAPWQYYLLLGVGLGAARAAVEIVGPRTAIANWFVRRRASAYALYSGGRAVSGVVLVPLVALAAQAWGWRAGWALMGVGVWLLVLPAAALAVRRRPEDLGLLPDGGPAMGATGRAPAPERVWTVRQVTRQSAFWLLVGGFILVDFPAVGIFIHLVPYLQETGLSATAAAGGVSLFAAGAVAGRPFWGAVSARLGVRGALVCSGVLYGVSVTTFGLAPGPGAVVGAAVVVGLTNGGTAQLVSQTWPDYFGRSIVGSLTGLTTLLITPASAIAPLVGAVVHDAMGLYRPVWVAFGMAGFGAAIAFALARRPR
jgi:MFS family permease